MERPNSYLEEDDSQGPALALLRKLGWAYLSPEEALEARNNRLSQPILENILAQQLPKFNSFTYKGESYEFSHENILQAIVELKNVPDAGLVPTNEKVYELLIRPKSLVETMSGDRKSYDLWYIDWDTPANNAFHVTDEFEVQGLKQIRRADIVLFVNGIPIAVIENKRRDKAQSVEEAISQHHTYQRKKEGIPQLYHYAQLLLAVQPNQVLYGTTNTARKFWSFWREPVEEPTAQLIRQERYGVPAEDRLPTEQDRSLYSLCRPERLLDLAYKFIVFDGGVKKIARYQQYFAVKETLRKVKQFTAQGSREGGVIWHTQGSGKSITMVLLSKSLELDPEIENPRTILVTDRVNLDKQIKKNFIKCGKTPAQARSGRELGQLITNAHPRVKNPDIITAVVDKFDSAMSKAEFQNRSPNIFVLVDESHRSQYGRNHAQMKKMLPNACYIGFTGTPLMKKEKSTAKKFGGIIHTYTIDDAVEDKAVLPLLYEGRTAIIEQHRKQMDRGWERIFANASEEEKIAYKRRYSTEDQLLKSDKVIEEVAYDIIEHYTQYWQGSGFKAQLAAPDKLTAIRYHRIFERDGRINTAVVISPPDSREDPGDLYDDAKGEVKRFWSSLMEKHGDAETYETNTIDTFESDSQDVEIIIVVSKLLTGFDAPRNTILYLCKKLVEHNLLQAIARVNRLFENKDYGYIVDYRGILGELDSALTTYSALQGFDEDDVKGAVSSAYQEAEKLPQKYSELVDVFKTLEGRRDKEEMERFLGDKERRDTFYEKLSEYAKSLHLAMSTEDFHKETPKDKVSHYLAELRFFTRLKASVQHRYAESINLKAYEAQVRKLMDSYIFTDGIEQTTEQVNIFETERRQEEVERVTGKTPASVADRIAYRRKRECRERLEEDPVLYKKFSQLIQQAIDDFQSKRISEAEYLKRMREIDKDFQQKTTAGTPDSLSGRPTAAAFFRILQEEFEGLDHQAQPEVLAKASIDVVEALRPLAIRDWKQNPDVHKQMEDAIDDYLYDFSRERGFRLKTNILLRIFDRLIHTARYHEWR